MASVFLRWYLQEFAWFLANLHWAVPFFHGIGRFLDFQRPKCVESLTQAIGFDLSDFGFLGDTRAGQGFFSWSLRFFGEGVQHARGNHARQDRPFVHCKDAG